MKKSAPQQPTTPVPNCAASFSNEVQLIINDKCATPGCHNSGALIGDFTTYAGLKPKIDNDRIRVTVFETKTMPYGTSPDLSAEELDKLKCWLDNGAPNN